MTGKAFSGIRITLVYAAIGPVSFLFPADTIILEPLGTRTISAVPSASWRSTTRTTNAAQPSTECSNRRPVARWHQRSGQPAVVGGAEAACQEPGADLEGLAVGTRSLAGVADEGGVDGRCAASATRVGFCFCFPGHGCVPFSRASRASARPRAAGDDGGITSMVWPLAVVRVKAVVMGRYPGRV